MMLPVMMLTAKMLPVMMLTAKEGAA